MAKKVVATLQTGVGKNFTKCIKMMKSPKTGAYMFDEQVVHNDHIEDYFKIKHEEEELIEHELEEHRHEEEEQK